MAPFHYTPLQEDYIRILHLDPALGRSDPIVCQLQPVPLSSSVKPEYEALSYVWGSPTGTIPILCPTESILVTPNLLVALQWLRLPDKPRTLWVDAICIDQADLAERSQQVRRMRDVYEYASRVIVWLGEEPAVSIGHDNVLLTLGLAFKLVKLTVANTIPLFVPDMNDIQDEISTQFPNIGRELPDLPGHALHQLIAYPWFTRMWIIQEAAVNSNTTVICGEDRIDWFDLVYVIEHGFQASELSRTERLDLARIQAITEARSVAGLRHSLPEQRSRSQERLSKEKLPKLLAHVQLFDATNPRDKIYAILGLVGEDASNKQVPVPDYECPVATVYSEYTRYAFQKCENLNLLHYLGSQRTLEDLPSWVPDYSVTNPEGRFPNDCFPDSQMASQSYKDLDFGEDWNRMRLELTSDPLVIVLSGMPISKISSLGPELLSNSSGSSSFGLDFATVCSQWEHLASQSHHSVKPKLQVFIETLRASEDTMKELKRNGYFNWYGRYGSNALMTSDLAETIEHIHLATGWDESETDSEVDNGPDAVRERERGRNEGGCMHVLANFVHKMALCQCSSRASSSPTESAAYSDGTSEGSIELCRTRIEDACYGRRFFLTSDGRAGLAPGSAREGDTITWLSGGLFPFIIRGREGGEHSEREWRMIGDCYLHSFEPKAFVQAGFAVTETYYLR